MDLALALKELLPGRLHETLDWDFIPWSFVEDRHPDLPKHALTALFDAYLRMAGSLDLEEIVSVDIPWKSWGCMRCGFCCVSRKPGPVSENTYSWWVKRGAPVAWFYKGGKRAGKNRVYRCWFNNGIRLRVCPFLLINRKDSKPACAIYQMGRDFRPSVCANYIPKHESCTNRPLALEPWEGM